MIDRGEALLSATGVRGVIEKTLGKITQAQRDEAAGIDARVQLLAAKLVLGTLGAGDEQPGDPFDYDGMLRDFSEPPDADQLAKMVAGFGPADEDDASAFQSCAGRAWRYLLGRYPVAVEQNLIGAVNRPVSSMALTAFEFELLIVDRPLAVFHLIDSGALLLPQAKAFVACYPTLQQAVIDAIQDRVTNETAEHQDYEPPFALAISTLVGAPYVDPVVTRGLAAAAQSRAADKAQQQASRPPQTDRTAAATAPPSRRGE